MKSRWYVIIAVVAVAAYLLGDLRGSEHDSKSSSPSSAFDLPTLAPKPRASLTKAEASALVRDFYGNIDSYFYGAAWRSLATAVRSEFHGFAEWRRGHRTSFRTDLTDLWIERTDRLEATAHVDLRTVDIDACGDRVVQRFQGTWIVKERAGRAYLDDPQIEKTGGADPTMAASDCPPKYPPAVATSHTSPSSGTDYDYDDYGDDAGAYGEDNSYDYDYDYDPPDYGSSVGEDLGPGNGYTVTCADGAISHSGGIQGACSSHGGVSGP